MQISDKYIFSSSNDLESIKKALKGGKLSGTSGIVEQYESKLANFFKSKYAIAISSGTAAIQTALHIAGISQGDEVVVPSTCPCMTVLPIMYINAVPVFCDTLNDNFGLDVYDLEKVVTLKTKAIIEVPMWGYPTNMEKLHNLSRHKNIPLIIDLAQSHGTKLNNKYLSSYGDVSCFSTHDRKLLATGEGGFILTDNEEYCAKAKSFVQFGNMNGIDFGLNYKIGTLQAAVGINRIDNINNQLKVRKANAKYITENINNPNVKEFKIVEGSCPNYYSLLLSLNFKNTTEIIKLLENNGIPSDIKRYNYKVLYQYPMFKKFKRLCAKSEKLVRNITTIPVHPALKKNELDYIFNKVNNLIEN